MYSRIILDAVYTSEEQTPIMPSKSLTNYFPRNILSEMPNNQKKAHIKVGDAVSFRAPSEAFCKMFNLALDASGLDRSGLCVEAINAGLPTVVAGRLDQIQKAGQEFLKQKPNGPDRQGKK